MNGRCNRKPAWILDSWFLVLGFLVLLADGWDSVVCSVPVCSVVEKSKENSDVTGNE